MVPTTLTNVSLNAVCHPSRSRLDRSLAGCRLFANTMARKMTLVFLGRNFDRSEACRRLAHRNVTYLPGAAASTKGATSTSAATNAFTGVPALITAWLPRITT